MAEYTCILGVGRETGYGEVTLKRLSDDMVLVSVVPVLAVSAKARRLLGRFGYVVICTEQVMSGGSNAA